MARNFFLLIILFNFNFANEFIFFAKLGIKDFQIKEQEINFSKAMIRSRGEKKIICKINVAEKITDELKFLNGKKNEIFDCFSNQKTRIFSQTKIFNNKAKSHLEFIILPIRFFLSFYNNQAIIEIIKG